MLLVASIARRGLRPCAAWRLVSCSYGARAHGTSEPCVGNAEGIAEEEWALKLGIFPVCV